MKEVSIQLNETKGNITDRIKCFADAAKETGLIPEKITILMATGDIDDEADAISAFIKLIIITKALNDGWVPDWGNSSEHKYYPWFDMSSGSGLSCHGCVYWYSNSHVGSRLCFKSRELAEYAGKQFIDLYKQLFIIKSN